jgi:hypothetical protein
VPEAGLEPAQRLAPPDFENLKLSNMDFFIYMISLKKWPNISVFNEREIQIQSDSITSILKPTGTKKAQVNKKEGYARKFLSFSMPPLQTLPSPCANNV